MNNVIVFGAGKLGKQLVNELEQCSEVQINGIADNHLENVSAFKYPMLDINSNQYFEANIIIAVAKLRNAVDIYEQLNRIGYKKIYWYNPNMGGISQDEFGGLHLIDCRNWGDCVLPQVEMHITDWCNLNCRGCAHFSPLFKNKTPNLDVRIEDVRKLKKFYSHIVVFYMLGGEPLLNPQLEQYICAIRKILPGTNLVLVTNGLLIPKIDGKVLECIRDNQVLVSISEYLPTHKILNIVIDRLEKYGVQYQIRPFDDKEKFNIPLSLTRNSIHKRKCISDGCINLYEGKIARCPTLMYIDRFNEVFHTKLPNEGIWELDDIKNGRELLDKLSQRVLLCDHCIEYEVPWSRCSGEYNLYDFATED